MSFEGDVLFTSFHLQISKQQLLICKGNIPTDVMIEITAIAQHKKESLYSSLIKSTLKRRGQRTKHEKNHVYMCKYIKTDRGR